MSNQSERERKVRYVNYVCKKLVGQSNIERKDLLIGVLRSLQTNKRISEKQLEFLIRFLRFELKKQDDEIRNIFGELTVHETSSFGRLPI